MTKLLSACFAAVLLASVPVHAGTESKSFKSVKEVVTEECRFRDTEFQVDAFYSGFFGDIIDDSNFKTGSGGGFGLNFFFAKYFGIGYEAAWYSNNGNVEHMPLGGNLFFRLPICKWNIAPYSMVGMGGAWDNEGNGKVYGNVGGGIEYRVTNNVGLFVDSRYFFGGTGNVSNLRTGLRFAF